MGPRSSLSLSTILVLLLTASSVFGESSPPTTPVPAEPVLTVTKELGTNSVVFNWTAPGGTSPFALSRCQHPNFAVGPTVPLQGGISGTTATDSGVLTDGNTYFYKVDDLYDGPKVFSLSASQGLPGAVITATGVNIDPSATANTVFINDVAAVPTASTTTTVQFTLPDGTVSGFIMVNNATGSSRPVPFTVLNSATPLSNITSLAVDSNHTAFVTDVGGAATSDKVYKINADHTLTQVGALNDPTGLGVDASDFVYYGNSFIDALNSGFIWKTNSAGTESAYGRGCTSSSPTSWIYATGVDRIGGTTVYAWDRNTNGIAHVPPGTGSCASTAYISTLGTAGGRPQGVAVNNNASSPRAHNLTITLPAPEIREYSTGPTPTLVKSWTPPTVPFVGVAQLAITPEPNERLLIADRTGNKLVLLNQATDASLALDWALTNPRAVAVDDLPDGRVNALVGEATSVKIFPLAFSVVNVQVWKERGSGVQDIEILDWFFRAQAYFLTVRVNLRLRGITTFTNAALTDLDRKAHVYNTVGEPYQFTTEESTLFSMRAADSRDLNVYVIRNLINVDTQAITTDPAAYTVTADLRGNVVDSVNSGIVVSGATLKKPENRGIEGVVMAHEIGHALLYQGSWPASNEHRMPNGSLYPAEFLMSQTADPRNTRFDAAEGNNISTNGPFIIFRSDP